MVREGSGPGGFWMEVQRPCRGEGERGPLEGGAARHSGVRLFTAEAASPASLW